MQSIIGILHKNFQQDHTNSRRFPGFTGVVDTLGRNVTARWWANKLAQCVSPKLTIRLKHWTDNLQRTFVHSFMLLPDSLPCHCLVLRITRRARCTNADQAWTWFSWSEIWLTLVRRTLRYFSALVTAQLYGTVYQLQFMKLTACIRLSASSKRIWLLCVVHSRSGAE